MEIYAIALSLIKGVGEKTVKDVLNRFSPEEIFSADKSTLFEIFGKKKTENFLSQKKKALREAEKIKKECLKKQIQIIPLTDSRYPELLKEIPDPPGVLYIKGVLPNKKAISVVGSRKFSGYGKFITEKFVKELSKGGINVVSGLAIGIDSIAHKTALKYGGLTTAVLGSGLDIIYPNENKSLFFEILDKGGAVISEYPPGTKPSKYTFPKRNRIIAGLSYGVIVMEAPKRSGALITAKIANDYGRIVFSIPTNINNPYGEGNNLLLKEGAVLVTDIKDIKEYISFDIKLEDKTDVHLSHIEEKILSILAEPTHIDVIVEKMDMDFDEVSVFLFELEMKGLVENQGGIYIKK